MRFSHWIIHSPARRSRYRVADPLVDVIINASTRGVRPEGGADKSIANRLTLIVTMMLLQQPKQTAMRGDARAGFRSRMIRLWYPRPGPLIKLHLMVLMMTPGRSGHLECAKMGKTLVQNARCLARFSIIRSIRTINICSRADPCTVSSCPASVRLSVDVLFVRGGWRENGCSLPLCSSSSRGLGSAVDVLNRSAGCFVHHKARFEWVI